MLVTNWQRSSLGREVGRTGEFCWALDMNADGTLQFF